MMNEALVDLLIEEFNEELINKGSVEEVRKILAHELSLLLTIITEEYHANTDGNTSIYQNVKVKCGLL